MRRRRCRLDIRPKERVGAGDGAHIHIGERGLQARVQGVDHLIRHQRIPSIRRVNPIQAEQAAEIPGRCIHAVDRCPRIQLLKESVHIDQRSANRRDLLRDHLVVLVLERLHLLHLRRRQHPRIVERRGRLAALEITDRLLHLFLARIAKPGHRIHGDRTRETRGAGYEFLHIAVDDHSRIACAAILPDQTSASATRFFPMARAQFSRFGVSCRRVLTGNGPCYRQWRSQKLLRRENLRQRFTRPYTPRTNGKAERFIQTALREWTYGRTYQNSTERTGEPEAWLHHYNCIAPMPAST